MKIKNDTDRPMWFVTPWLKAPLLPGEEMEVTQPLLRGVMWTTSVEWIESAEDPR